MTQVNAFGLCSSCFSNFNSLQLWPLLVWPTLNVVTSDMYYDQQKSEFLSTSTASRSGKRWPQWPLCTTTTPPCSSMDRTHSMMVSPRPTCVATSLGQTQPVSAWRNWLTTSLRKNWLVRIRHCYYRKDEINDTRMRTKPCNHPHHDPPPRPRTGGMRAGRH